MSWDGVVTEGASGHPRGSARSRGRRGTLGGGRELWGRGGLGNPYAMWRHQRPFWVGGGASKVERVCGPFEGCVTHFEAACCFYRRKV